MKTWNVYNINYVNAAPDVDVKNLFLRRRHCCTKSQVLVPVKFSRDSLIFESKAEVYQSGAPQGGLISGAGCQGRNFGDENSIDSS